MIDTQADEEHAYDEAVDANDEHGNPELYEVLLFDFEEDVGSGGEVHV